ncbi:unnamed protein product [Bathycoccus prasinos]
MHIAVSPSLANDSKYPLTQSPVGGLLGGGDGEAGGGGGGDGGGGGAIHVERTVLHDEGLTLYCRCVAQVYFAWNAVASRKVSTYVVNLDVSQSPM